MLAIAQPDLDVPYASACDMRVTQVGLDVFRARPKVSLLEWAEEHRRWPDESPYRVSETPHVREILEAYSDPAIEEITIVKPTQSGLTEGLALNAIGYHVDADPRDILIVVPSVDEAKKWSKKKLDPMIDATPRVQGRLEDGSRKDSNTINEKTFTGGSLGIIGSNSGRGFRMVTIGVAIGDDVEGWDATAGKGAGSEGSQVTLIRRRTDRVPDRKLVWISTPRLDGGRIHQLYQEMESRGEWHVPCPHCGELQVLRWGGPGDDFGVKWKRRKVEPGYVPEPGEVLHGLSVHEPDTAYYQCVNGCRIEESSKAEMEARGEYLEQLVDESGAVTRRPVRRPGVRTVGYWLRGALTITLPGSEWPRLIREYLGVLGDTEKLKAFFNLVLGEFWKEPGEAPEWRLIYERREDYPMGTCPEGVVLMTAGVDVQKDRVEVGHWGWGVGKESWLVDYVVIDRGNDVEAKAALTEQLHRSFPGAAGGDLPVARLAIDTGYDQLWAIDWARSVGDRRVMLVKGDHWKNWTVIVGTPTKSEITRQGKRFGYLLWPVGGALIKQETYGFLRLPAPLDGEPYPPGWIHLPALDEERIKQLVAEELQTNRDKRGFTHQEWVLTRGRNEFLDIRVYARAAAEACGIGRLVGTSRGPSSSKRPPEPTGPSPDGSEQGPGPQNGRRGSWLPRGGRRRRGRWL